MAIKACFWYYDYVGDEPAALAVNRGEHEYRHALLLYRGRRFPQALATAERATARGHRMAWVERGFILAEMPDGQKRALAAYDEATARLKDYGTGAESLGAPMILLFLGHKQQAQRAYREISPDLVPPWHNRWYFSLLDYNCGRKSATELIEASGGARPLLSEAHLSIGLHCLADGDREGAREHFRQCAQTRAFIYWDYYWARAFLDRLDNDPTWPPWIPQTH
jgi:hypothetical protein